MVCVALQVIGNLQIVHVDQFEAIHMHLLKFQEPAMKSFVE